MSSSRKDKGKQPIEYTESSSENTGKELLEYLEGTSDERYKHVIEYLRALYEDKGKQLEYSKGPSEDKGKKSTEYLEGYSKEKNKQPVEYLRALNEDKGKQSKGLSDDNGKKLIEYSKGMEQLEYSKYITVKLRSQRGIEAQYKMKRTTKFQKLMNEYCDRQSESLNDVMFLFDGRRIRGDQTPNDLDVEDGDQINAMCHKSGGAL